LLRFVPTTSLVKLIGTKETPPGMPGPGGVSIYVAFLLPPPTTMDALYQARIASHKAAIEFHGALKEHLIAKRPSNQQPANEAARQAQIVSEADSAALNNLLNCLLESSAGSLPAQKIGHKCKIREADLALVADRKLGRPSKKALAETEPPALAITASEMKAVMW
jgi:hypothetical protein